MTARIRKHTFRTAYDTGTANYSESFPEGLTEQHHTDSCDINLILAQFMETGIMPNQKIQNPQYGDVSEHSFQEIQTQLANAKNLFEELPEHVKQQFEHQPFKFLKFAEDPKNLPHLVEMGLANAPTPEDNALQTDSKGSPFVSGKDEVAPSQNDDQPSSSTVAT